MDHPLIHENHSGLRQRVIQLLRSAYSVLRDGNIIFVCGGNKPGDMRQRFRAYCVEKHPELEIFFPEFAMNNYLSSGDVEPFDISDFENLVGELSHAIVLFPEAPGSYAETGYFSVLPELAKKTVLAMDSYYQGKDSFISLGPAVKINATSRFNSTIQTSYLNPEFEYIVERINRVPMPKNRRALSVDKFKDLSSYEVFCLIHKCFSIMRIATIYDIVFIFRSLFRSRFSVQKVKQLTSILVGAEYLVAIGDYGHFRVNAGRGELLQIRTGFFDDEARIRLELANIYTAGDREFLELIDGDNCAA